jgi:hypothetical protein
MKKILPILSVLILLTSCVKYAQPPLLSLSGLYVIDKLVTNDSTYYVGDTFDDSSDILLPSLDTVYSYIIGDTLFEMDYSMIRFNPIQGGVNWEKEYYYYSFGQLTTYDFGYIKFNCEGTNRTWRILDDGIESLVIRIPPNKNDEYMVLYLTRIGP